MAEQSPPSADVEVAKLRLWLDHVSLRDLEARGILHRDRDDDVVRKGDRFDEVWNRIAR